MAAPNTVQNKPVFQGKPVVELPVPIAGFLTDSYGEEVFREAEDLAKCKYRNAYYLSTAIYKNNVIKGSNLFYVVLINEVLRLDLSQRLRTATPADIERTLRAGDILGIKGKHYVDTALVLRSQIDSSYPQNDPLSRDLFSQLKQRQGRKLKFPVMIPLCGLELKLGTNQYGLSFVLREDAEVVYASVLNKPGRFDSENVNPKTGLPNETGNKGSRIFYTRRDGLSRLFLDYDLRLGANWSNLGDSYAGGQVAVCDEAITKNLLDKI